MPIGNLTSQLWANFYLDGLDHRIQEEWRAPGYARYTDDWLVWADDKEYLHDLHGKIGAELDQVRLRMNTTKTRLFPVRMGVPFLGFRFFPGRRPRVAGETKRRFEKRTRRQLRQVAWGRLELDAVRESAFGWTQFARYGDVEGLIRRYRQKGFGQPGP